MAIAIVLGFAVCWLPLAIFWCILLFTHTIQWSNCVIHYVFHIVSFTTVGNSAINPCICLILSRNYRNELRALFK